MKNGFNTQSGNHDKYSRPHLHPPIHPPTHKHPTSTSISTPPPPRHTHTHIHASPTYTSMPTALDENPRSLHFGPYFFSGTTNVSILTPIMPPVFVQLLKTRSINLVIAGSFIVSVPGYYSCGLSTYSTTPLTIIKKSPTHIGAVCAAQVSTPSHTLSPAACTALVQLKTGDEVYVTSHKTGQAFVPYVRPGWLVIPYLTFHCHMIKATRD